MYNHGPALKTARALASQARLTILQTLLTGEATVSDLVEHLQLDQPRASAHLAILSRAGLVFAERAGRQRAYSVNKNHIEALLDAMQPKTFIKSEDTIEPTCISATSTESPGALRERRSNTPLRQARSCYDHLAGVAGVRLLEEMLREEWLVADDRNPESYVLTAKGETALQDRGVDLLSARNGRRLFARACLDWTERRPHLAGSLGAAILQSLEKSSAVERDPNSRALKLRPAVFNWLSNPARPSVPHHVPAKPCSIRATRL